ncbi:transposase [Streptomyces mirabilis]|uniref:transposase n=1 Tax=Streptomyces mirabilis TaxID=68239 RepID=UPI0036F11D26
MTDAQSVVRDALPVPAWMEGRGGQPEGYCHRQMLDAVFYVTDNGIEWRAMPVDFPAWDRVYAFFRSGGSRAWPGNSTTGFAGEFAPRRAATVSRVRESSTRSR